MANWQCLNRSRVTNISRGQKKFYGNFPCLGIASTLTTYRPGETRCPSGGFVPIPPPGALPPGSPLGAPPKTHGLALPWSLWSCLTPSFLCPRRPCAQLVRDDRRRCRETIVLYVATLMNCRLAQSPLQLDSLIRSCGKQR